MPHLRENRVIGSMRLQRRVASELSWCDVAPPYVRGAKPEALDRRRRAMNSDEDQIRQVVRTWMDATRRGDTQAVLDLITDDAIFLVPGKPPFGKHEFARAAQAQAQPDGTKFDGRSTIQEIRVSGDWAFMVTRLTVTA